MEEIWFATGRKLRWVEAVANPYRKTTGKGTVKQLANFNFGMGDEAVGDNFTAKYFSKWEFSEV